MALFSIGRHRTHPACTLGLRMLVVLLVWLGVVAPALAQSPAAMPYPSTGRYVGTIQDSEEGQLDTDQSMSFTSATQFVVPPNTTGTYTYAKTGANTATMTYQAHTVVGEYEQHESTTVLLTFTGTTTGNYTAAGSYTGSYYGLPFSGTLSNGVGTFNFKVLPTVTTPTHAAVQATSATLGGTVASDGAGTITTRGVVCCLQSVSSTPEVNGSGVTLMTSPGTTGPFTVNATGLAPGVTYAYRAVAINEIGRGYSPPGTFTTTATAPAISTPTHTSVTHFSAVLGGNVTSDCGSAITERGVVYATSATNSDPLIGGTGVTKAVASGTTGVFTTTTTVTLLPSTQYSFKAYATNALGTTYTSPATVFATFSGPPVPSAPSATNVSPTTATLGGSILSDGGANVTERGVVLAETAVNGTPAIGGNGVSRSTSVGTTGTFSVNFTGLTPNTSYSFRAYGTNTYGTAYTSPVSTFTTSTGPPVLSTPTSIAVTSGTATLGGTLIHHGGASVSGCGVVYAQTSVNADPQIGGSGVTQLITSATSGTFTVNASGLLPATSYTFRAYASSDLGTGYTTPAATFTTLPLLPTVTTPTYDNVAARTATLGGNVTSDGAGGITERGVVCAPTATDSSPTLGAPGVQKTIATGTTGVFTTSVSGLTPFTNYTFRVYATNASGTSYSLADTFTTLAAVATINTPTSTTIMATTADLGGTVTQDNGAAVTERGVVWSRTSVNFAPRIGGNGVTRVATSGGIGTFSVTATGMSATTNYTYAAYAINSAGTTYTGTSSFTTLAGGPPTVNTPTKTNITNATATLGGNVAGDGNNLISERGVVYARTSSNSNPTIGGGSTTKVAVSGTTGIFSVDVTGLSSSTGYSFKAYAINAGGTSYSAVSTFTTNATGPGTVVLAASTQEKLDITLRGNITSQGGLTITERGVVYAKTGVNAMPSIGGTGVVKVVSSSSAQSGVFSVAVMNLDPFSDYSWRPYVTNSAGTAYSATADTFSTTVGNPTVAAPTSTGITGTTATLGATVVTTGGQPINFYGVCYALTSVNNSPRPNGTGVTKVDGTASFTGPGAFTVNVTGLIPASSYTFSVYAGHDGGIIELFPAGSFTTLTLTHKEGWRQTHFGSTANTGSAADGADHDKDGLANLIEYAFGLTPTTADTGLMPKPQHHGTSFSITFTQPAEVSGVTYGAQWSSTLLPGSWANIPDTGTGMTHTFSVPASNGPTVFIQLKVTSP